MVKRRDSRDHAAGVSAPLTATRKRLHRHRSINMQVRRGSLVALVGSVASGKSSVLAAVLAEMNKVHGTVRVSGRIGFVPQSAWILNGTVQENILFGRDLHRSRYTQIMDACALQADLGERQSAAFRTFP